MNGSNNPHLKWSLAEIRRRLYEWGEKPHRLSDSEVLQRFSVLKARYADPAIGQDEGAGEELTEAAAPPSKEPAEEIVEEKNWIFVQHQRRQPGPKRRPEDRAVTDLRPVESTADVYEKGGGLLATVKLPADGKKLKVEVPPGVECEVVFHADHGGAYKIEDEPYSNPFVDETKSPSPGQAYLLKHLRKIGV